MPIFMLLAKQKLYPSPSLPLQLPPPLDPPQSPCSAHVVMGALLIYASGNEAQYNLPGSHFLDQNPCWIYPCTA